jgi:hypothetical protein
MRTSTTVVVEFTFEPEDAEDLVFNLADILRDYAYQLEEGNHKPDGKNVGVLNGSVTAEMSIHRG